MYSNPDLVVVSARGTANSKFSRSSFKASVVTVAATGPLAKQGARPTIDAIRGVVSEHAKSARIDTERLKTTFEVAPNRVYQNNEHVTRGYKATYTISFSCADVVEALRVHDALTSLEGVTAETPVFHMDSEGETADAAFKDAFNKAKAAFASQCAAAEVSPSAFRVATWSVEDETPRGKTLSMVSNAAMTDVDVEPGKAVLDVKLNVTFQRVS